MTRSEQDEIAAKLGTTIKADSYEYAAYLNKNEIALLRDLQRGGKE